jgi:hypothetical protein
MTLPRWLSEALTLSLALSRWQQLGLAFLLGSFAVATWSDLKHLAAQREFREIWLLFLASMLAIDVYEGYTQRKSWEALIVKWGLIGLFSVMSLRRGPLFRLATSDVAALAAAASLLHPLLIVIFYLTARLLATVLGPLLARGQPFYPFMPVVSLAALGVLAVGLMF